MRHKKEGRKAQIAANKVLLASVKEEMAQPRMSKSAKMKIDKQSKPTDGERV